MTLVSRILGSLAKLPRATSGDVAVDRDLPVKMSDGVVLFADRWHPAGPQGQDAPVVLVRTPYGRRQWAGVIGRLFAERGYQTVIQSCRGTFGSGGEWVAFRNEKADGHDTVDWVVDQPWFTGKLATFGPSYLGLTQWAIASDPPDCLKALALDVTASNFRDAVVYPSDCFALGTGLTWLRLLEFQEQGVLRSMRAQRQNRRILTAAYDVLPVADADVAAVGHHVPFFQDWLEHEDPADTWWEPIRFGRSLAHVPPASLVGGWYDIFLPSQLDDYQALRAAGRQARLTIGPWSHSSPGTIAASLRDGLEWFDLHLNDVAITTTRSAIRLFVMGSRRWQDFPDWPPPAEEQLWYLGGDGSLGRSPPEHESPDRYNYNPADPTPAIGGPSLNWNDAGPRDQQRRESRRDVLTYTSAVLAETMTVIGPISVDLHVRSTNDHCDYFVRLCDVSPKGRSKNLSDGIVRARPGGPARSADGTRLVHISMWPTANAFAPGHRVRLQVSSGAHPLFVRHSGTDEALLSSTSLRVAEQEIFHDADHRSCLRLPVTKG